MSTTTGNGAAAAPRRVALVTGAASGIGRAVAAASLVDDGLVGVMSGRSPGRRRTARPIRALRRPI